MTIAIRHKTITTVMNTKINTSSLENGASGLRDTDIVEVGDGLGRADVVGLGVTFGKMESDITNAVPSLLATNISPLAES